MPEHLRALVVIMGIALPVFWLGRKAVAGLGIDAHDFTRRRNLWFTLVLLAFLAHNFWVYVIVAALVLSTLKTTPSSRLAAFCFLMFAVPPFEDYIPGIGGIRQLFAVSHLRLLSLTLLLPAFLELRRDPASPRMGSSLADKCLLGYLILPLMLQLQVDSFTNTLRYGLYAFTDVFLPYYVASRSLRSVRQFQDVLTSLVVAVVFMSAIAVFEYVRHWLLYSSLDEALGVTSDYGLYLGRADSLRALASAGHSLALGYAIAIGTALFAFVSVDVVNARLRTLAIVVLVAGLYATLSRGPWVGAALGAMVLLLTGPNRSLRLGKVIAIGLPLVGALMLTPYGDKLIDLLPFVGTVDEGNVTYRQRLFEVSMQVVWQYPWFGSFDYMRQPAMQQLIQGQGIIDLVNSYLAIALTYGFVGLTLFSGVFLHALLGTANGIRILPSDDERSILGRSLLAATLSMLVMIAAVSSILSVPWLYWLLAGMGLAYARLAREPAPYPLEPEPEVDPLVRWRSPRPAPAITWATARKAADVDVNPGKK
jgi:hypothetical protein